MKTAQRVARIEIAHVAVASPTATPPASVGAIAIPGVLVGGFVWLYSRENGRTTENLGKVTTINGDGTLDVVVNDQGTKIDYRGVKLWSTDSIVGYAPTARPA